VSVGENQQFHKLAVFFALLHAPGKRVPGPRRAVSTSRMALNKQEFTRNQRVKEIALLLDARFPVTVSQLFWLFGLFAAYYLFSDDTESNTAVGGTRWSDMEAR
jgi:hypothetical protein